MNFGSSKSNERSGPVMPSAPIFEKLWTNPAGGEAFESQNIPLDLAPYEFIVVLYRTTYSYSNGKSIWLSKDNRYGYMQSFYNLTGATAYLNHRTVSYTNTYINFGANTRKAANSTTAGAENNNYNIPNIIYGVRNLQGAIPE